MRWVRVLLFPAAVAVDLLFVRPVLGPMECTCPHAATLDFGPPPRER